MIETVIDDYSQNDNTFLLNWVVIKIALCAKVHKTLGYVFASLWQSCAAQTLDCVIWERWWALMDGVLQTLLFTLEIWHEIYLPCGTVLQDMISQNRTAHKLQTSQCWIISVSEQLQDRSTEKCSITMYQTCTKNKKRAILYNIKYWRDLNFTNLQYQQFAST